MSTQHQDLHIRAQQAPDHNMSADQAAFASMNYPFDAMMSSYSMDQGSHQQNMGDNPVMWGGMQQLSLDKDMVQQWPSGLGQDMYDQQAGARHLNLYGQITPPNDKSSEMPQSEIPQEVKMEADTAGMTQGIAEPSDGTTKSKRTNAKRRSKEGDELQPGKTKKTSRKARKGYKALTVEDEFDSDGEMKRERFLERNRVAASKCRQKKKVWTNGLESHARAMAAANAHLNACALSLREEVLYLKSECLKHTDCNCTRIREYLDRSIAGMAPSRVLNNLSQQDGVGHRKLSNDSVYTFASHSSPTDDVSGSGDSRQNSLSVESQASGRMIANQSRSDRDMQVLLEASIATTGNADAGGASTS